MKIKAETDVLRRKADLLAELVTLGETLVRGALVRTRRKCGRPGCACEKGARHPFCYLSRSVEGRRNKIVYVRPVEEKAFEAGLGAYRRAWEVIEELSAINIDIVKRRVGDGQGTDTVAVADGVGTPRRGGR